MYQYNVYPKIFIRTPTHDYKGYKLSTDISRKHDSHLLVAFALANPIFFTLRSDQPIDTTSPKELLSYNKYINRLTFRPTPFGAFASFSVGSWGKDKSIELVSLEQAQLHLNLDQQVALQLGAKLLQERSVDDQRFSVNPTLYKMGKEYRFLTTRQVSGSSKLLFELDSFQVDKLVDRVIELCVQISPEGSAIIKLITDTIQCDLAMAQEYLSFLTDAQILVNLERPYLVGPDHLTSLLDNNTLARSPLRSNLKDLIERMKDLTIVDFNRLQDLNQELQKLLNSDISYKNYFYAGLERRVISGSLDHQYQDQIKASLEALRVLSLPSSPERLNDFIRQFEARYERRKVPLLIALDPESGINYTASGVQLIGDELLNEIVFERSATGPVTLQWTAAHRLLLRKWNALKDGDRIICITPDDIAELNEGLSDTLPTPASISVMFRVLDDHLYIESAGGISATALIGRFTLWSPEVHQIAQETAALEQKSNPEMIFAELGQLSDTHADNINRRLPVYPYEILINAPSVLPQENQLPLSDLLLSVVNGRLVLESRRLGRQIIPRLSSAYNYNRNEFAPFQLLCDLQYQGLHSNFDLDMARYFPGMGHYPRVIFGDTILYRATWSLSADDIRQLTTGPKDATLLLFDRYRQEWHWPAVISLKRHDQYLVFHLDRSEDVLFLRDCLKGSTSAVIQEFFLPVKPVVSADGKGLVDQFVAFLYRSDQIYHTVRTPSEASRQLVVRNYLLGSKWLYLKLYCQPSLANDLLAQKISPLLKKVNADRPTNWFFVRYRDSQYHIRLRIKVDEGNLGRVLTLFQKALAGDVGQHLIREYQADTYRRELERYGADMINEVEVFSGLSSALILKYIYQLQQKRTEVSYHSLAFSSVENLLEIFLPDLKDRVGFCEQMSLTFQSEFSGQRSLRIDLDRKYRDLRTDITQVLSSPDHYAKLGLLQEQQKLTNGARRFSKKIRRFGHERRIGLIADLIHMHLNRLFVDDQRRQELVVYHCLYKHSLSRLARGRSA
ncbi:lantibiotic dehydratase [Mucilaginibacter sp. CSA2-8R]|uniref:lantibiotic dehydratase n=1 Tax=Mucilaginibacter sp. CSA2-8R TaxID=3141542 RepID=UPI00315DC931